jgi:hypothetical protein
MAAVHQITPHLRTMPAPDDLKTLPSWLIWRYESAGDGTKPRKVPYYADGSRRHGKQGAPDDVARLVTFDAAVKQAATRGFTGVGFATRPGMGIVALDFDNCVGAEGIHPEVLALVSGTYAEYSPSGQGVRAFFKGDLGDRKAFGDPFGFETFSTKGFVTFTGNTLADLDLVGLDNVVAPLPAHVRDYATTRFGPAADALGVERQALGMTRPQLQQCLAALNPDLTYDKWLQVGMAIHHETDGDGFDLWDDWSARGSKYPSTEALQFKWDSFGRTGNGTTVTARSLIKLANQAGAGINLSLATIDDFEDLTEFEGDFCEDSAKSEAILPGKSEKTEKPGKFHVYQAAEFARGKSPGWHIKGVLPAAPLVLVFGESGSGKSFLVLDMVMSCLRSTPWRGAKTKPGAWIYIAAEGAGGVRRRLEAYAHHHGLDLAELDLGIIGNAPNILAGADITELAAAINAWQRARGVRIAGIVVDTMAQVTPGANENSGEDMGLALSNLDALRRGTGATTMVPIHHAGKDASKGARGWSGMRAAADAELEVRRMATGRAVKVTKQKDAEDGLEYGFGLLSVAIGWDEDDEAITSCVIEEAELPTVQDTTVATNQVRRGANEKLIMEIVEEFAMGQSAGIEVSEILDEAMRRHGGDGPAYTKRGNFKRALTKLSEGEHAIYYTEDDGKTIGLLG